MATAYKSCQSCGMPLRKDPLMLITHPQHPLAKHKAVKLKELAGQKFVSFEPDIPTRKAIDRNGGDAYRRH